jgi:hypothetical protein
MKDILCSKRYEWLEVQYQFSFCSGSDDVPECIRIDILHVQALDSSINLYDFLSRQVMEGLEEEITEQIRQASDGFNETEWEERRWAA